MNIHVGDKLRIPGFPGTLHYGIFVGSTRGFFRGVVHNAKGLGVVLSEFDEFATGHPVVIETRVTGGWWAQRQVAHRALSLIGRSYDLVNFNCEHAATWAQSGEAKSPQVGGYLLAALLLVGLLALSEG
jgi:hypothetical protein